MKLPLVLFSVIPFQTDTNNGHPFKRTPRRDPEEVRSTGVRLYMYHFVCHHFKRKRS